MFSTVNMNTSPAVIKYLTFLEGERAIIVEDGMKEILDLKAFKHALQALCMAAHHMVPLNHSYSALYNIMHNMQPSPNTDRFQNAVFKMNANNWFKKEGFLTTGELKTTWLEFIANRPTALFFYGSGQNRGQFQSNLGSNFVLSLRRTRR